MRSSVDKSSGGGSGETTVPTSDEQLTIDAETPALGVVSRAMSTDGNIEMHVGDGYAYRSLQAAFNDIPHYAQHEVRIYVHGRTADTNTAHIHSVSMANHVDFIVDGSDDGVVNDGGVNVSIYGKLDHIQFNNLTFEFLSQCQDARFENCVFNGNGRAAFSGKMGGKMLINCTIGTGGDEYAIESIGNEMCEIRNCTLNATEAAVKGTAVSVHTFTGENEIHAPEKYIGYADEVWGSGLRLDT